MRRWGYFFGILIVIAASCVYAARGAQPTSAASTNAIDVGLEWSGPPGINDGLPVSAVSCTSSTFCMAIGNWCWGACGIDVSTFNGNGWSEPSDTFTQDGPDSLSCTSETFCMATGYGGYYETFDGSTWSASSTFLAPPAMINGATHVSCASPLLCVAFSVVEGTVYTYNGSAWSEVPSFGTSLAIADAVSCAASSLCVVSAGDKIATFDGTTWSTTTGASFPILSCGAPSLCVGSNGNDVEVFNGSSWTDDGVVDPDGSIIAVSCSGTSYCAAVDGAGNVVQYDGTNWTVGPVVESRNYSSAPALEELSCASSTFCVAIDQDDNVFYNNDGTWTSNDTTTFDGNDPQFSCASATLCFGVDTDGEAVTFNASTWSGPGDIGLTRWGNVSCAPSSTFCMAVDDRDTGVIYDGQSWTDTPTPSSGDNFLISCPAAGSCIGMGGTNTYIYSDGTWSESSADTSDATMALSCASMSFCAATDQNGDLFTFNGTAWSMQSGVLPTEPSTTNYSPSVSCPVVGFCMAVDIYGDAITYQDGSWSVQAIGAQSHGFPEGLASVSCATTSFCVAINTGGTTVVYENSVWTQITPMGPDLNGNDAGSSVSCPTTTFCVGMDGAGLAQYLYPNTTTTTGGAIATAASPAQAVTYTATVADDAPDLIASPTGYVTFSVGSKSLCSARLSGGTASCISNATLGGSDNVSAQYSGDIYFQRSSNTSQLGIGDGLAAPIVSIITPAEGGIYGVDSTAQANYSCQPAAGTTLSSCTGPVSSGSDIGTSASDVGVHQFSVEAEDADGQTTAAATTYTIVGAPSITSFSPPKGPSGSVVTIDGTNLASATSVTLGRAAAKIVTDTASTITFDVPTGAKTGFILVTTPGGGSKSTHKFKVKR